MPVVNSILQQTKLSLDGAVWLCSEGKQVLNDKHLRLLEAIDETGSISAAARSLPMSYKAASGAVDSLNNLSLYPLITTSAGGRAGGGAKLTEYGRQTIVLLSKQQKAYTQFLDLLPVNPCGLSVNNLLRRLTVKTSARNSIVGRISGIVPGAVNCQIAPDINKNHKLVVVITNESRNRLEINEGSEVIALIKASSIIVALLDQKVRYSARNCLCATVVRCLRGAVNIEIVCDIGDQKRFTAVITNESADSLSLAEGKEVELLIKASQVILTTTLA